MEDNLNTPPNSSKVPFIVGGIILFAVVGYFLLAKNKNYTNTSVPVTTSANQEARPQTGKDTNAQSEFDKRYVAYSADNLVKATKDGRAVVFFHASWCPLCQEAEADLKVNWGKVPGDVTILKTDYDSSKELKTKYGVVSQDTWVQVDEEANEIAKWNSGGKGLQTLLANLK